MNDFPPPAATPLGTLDPLSRRRLVCFVIRLGGLTALAFGPCLNGTRPVQDANALFSLACSLGGFVSMIFAKLAREPLAEGGLNGWDEALAFVGAAQLAHFAF